MIGLDTNVLVRFLVRDHPAQYEKSRDLIETQVAAGQPVLVNLLVLLETEWVLRSRYELAKTEVAEVLSALLDTTEIVFEDEPTFEEALYVWKRSNADFADCLIGVRNRRLGCEVTATFDARAAKLEGYVAA